MYLERGHLLVLLNGLYDLGTTTITISHPNSEIGDLLRIRLRDDDRATVKFETRIDQFREARDAIRLEYGDEPYRDLPSTTTFVKALTASGIVEFANQAAIESTLETVCYPAVEAGDSPVMVGLDANIVPWKFPDLLGIDHESGSTDQQGRRPTNGYALSNGVVDELHWNFSYSNVDSLVEAFGEEFRRLEGQPDGAKREGRLGIQTYQSLIANRSVDFVDSETGDEAIVDGYVRYNKNHRKKPFLLSNDYGFVEEAATAGLPAQHLQFKSVLPRHVETTWGVVADTLYYLALLFGVIVLPKATLYGVWTDKADLEWQTEEIDIECRGANSNLQGIVARHRHIVREFDRITQ